MKKVFKKVKGETIKDLPMYIAKVLKKYPYAEIHVGTDSQNARRHTVYSTVIAFRYGFRGVHYIYTKHRVKKIKNIFERLFKEAEESIEVAEWLKENMPSIEIQIDMDYNSDEQHVSHKLVSSTKGWAESLGYKVNIKPYSQIATKAADHECR